VLKSALISSGILIAAVLLNASRAEVVQPISADALRDEISYLSSEKLDGRLTPSPGLELAADYIASKFQNSGLEPAAPQYFQSAKFDQAKIDFRGFTLNLSDSAKEVSIQASEVRVQSLAGLDVKAERILKLPANGIIPNVTGRVVAGDESRYNDEILLNALIARRPALVLIVGKTDHTPPSPLAPDPAVFVDEDGNSVPIIHIHKSEARDLLHKGDELKLSVHLAPPQLKKAAVRNVVGTLPGSDPVLRNQFVLVTAHYDHMGRNARGYFPGANDNASGTASVIEIAKALASTGTHPKRSIIFMALFGEEEGLLGAYYYAHHPLVPLKDTVADINLEQMGRTDDPSGKHIREFGLTGPSFSNVQDIVSAAAKDEGINVYVRKDADLYFDRSDNFAFAQFGIVAHTAAVAFEYRDYHEISDTPEKIDYANLAAVDRGLAAGVAAIANASRRPQWSNSPGAVVYRTAGR